jgi:hypothetical protein
VSEALISLPWVDSDNIKTDLKKRQARFKVKDRAKFNVDELRRALGPRYGDGMKVLAGPTSEEKQRQGDKEKEGQGGKTE